jgi:hypothetical protein
MQVTMPTEKFNTAVKDGSAGRKVNHILEEARAEAVYFTEMNGLRTAIMIVDVPEPSKIPVLAEPWFLTFGAKVEFRLVMSPDELGKAGLDSLGKKWA